MLDSENLPTTITKRLIVTVLALIVLACAAVGLSYALMKPGPQTVNAAYAAPTTITTVSASTTVAPTTTAVKPKIGTSLVIVRSPVVHPTTPIKLTTTTAALPLPERIVAIAQHMVGTSPPYAAGGFWCALFASDVAVQAKATSFQTADSPGLLYGNAQRDGRLTTTPAPGDLVFIDLSGSNNTATPGYITHVGIVEAVNGTEVQTIEGNANPTPNVVSRHVRHIGDGFVIGFAPVA